ncbi:MAG: hypothetical protein II212_01250 [Alistipes sp.]|nr:hypothetical protein [Alistipes sp.]
MKKTNIFAEYITPTLELCYTPVESGFAASLDGSGGIKDWENDGDSLDF